MRERDIEKYGCKRTADIGGVAIKLTSSGNRGLPDRLHYFPFGIHILVEYKAPGRKPRPDQIRWHDRFGAMGHAVLVIDSLAGVDAMITVAERWVARAKLGPCKHGKECIHYVQ